MVKLTIEVHNLLFQFEKLYDILTGNYPQMYILRNSDLYLPG